MSCFVKLFLIRSVFFFHVSPAAPWTSCRTWGWLGWEPLVWRYQCRPALARRPEWSPVNAAWRDSGSIFHLGDISWVSQREEFQPRGEMLIYKVTRGTSLNSEPGSAVTSRRFHSVAFSLGWKSLGVFISYGNFLYLWWGWGGVVLRCAIVTHFPRLFWETFSSDSGGFCTAQKLNPKYL